MITTQGTANLKLQAIVSILLMWRFSCIPNVWKQIHFAPYDYSINLYIYHSHSMIQLAFLSACSVLPSIPRAWNVLPPSILGKTLLDNIIVPHLPCSNCSKERLTHFFMSHSKWKMRVEHDPVCLSLKFIFYLCF